MELKLRYGRSGLVVTLPDENISAVCRLNPLPKIDEPGDAVERSLRKPIGAEPLAELAIGKETACVVVSDITRPVPNKVILPPLLRTLEESGVARSKINLLIATGTHRPNTYDELREMVGDEILKNYTIINHDCRDLEAHIDLGITTQGVPIIVDRRYYEADLKIVTGLIEPHLMAGYSGGRKLVCPGISALEVVKVFHSPGLLEHPNATTGVIQDNPVHGASCQAINKAGCDFSVMVTMDEARNVIGVFGGNVHASFFAGVDVVDEAAKVELDEPADIVITSSAGHPLDMTFYQAVKGLIGVLPIVKEGGTIILAASLSEGIGSTWFSSIYDEVESLEDFMHKVTSGGEYWDEQWQVEEQARVAKKADVMVFSEGVSDDELSRAFVTPIDSVESGLEAALSKHGAGAQIAVVPDGPYVMPVLNGKKQ